MIHQPLLLSCVLGCGLAVAPLSAQAISAEEARTIGREAYVYGFPMVENYEAMHRQAVAPGPLFRAPFNQWAHEPKPATPQARQNVWPNADAALSSAWLDLRAEPIVLTLPAIEKERYYSAQLVDLFTFNFGYFGTRTTGNEGGDFLIAGPNWQGEKPADVREVIRSETQFAGLFIRTQFLGPKDFDRIQEIQAGYRLRPLSTLLGQPVVAAEPPPAWPPPRKDMTDGLRLFPYVNFLLQYTGKHPSDSELMARFARLGIGPGLAFDPSAWSPAVRQSVTTGIADVWSKNFPEVMKRIQRGELTAAECFGSRDFFNGDIVKRAIGAKVGLHGNSSQEVFYIAYFTDRDGRPFDASSHRYTLRFEKDQWPPCEAFWSVTVYDANTHLLVPNALQRHVINSTMKDALTLGDDGSLTIHIQKKSPGKSLEANWLPAPNGPFHCLLRLYLPKPDVLSKTWMPPALERRQSP
ncbi:MAG: DUF1254 domain-containing protein [Verrucomicrobiales bacterium]